MINKLILNIKNKLVIKKRKAAIKKCKKYIERESKRTDTILGVEVPANDAHRRGIEELKRMNKFNSRSLKRIRRIIIKRRG